MSKRKNCKNFKSSDDFWLFVFATTFLRYLLLPCCCKTLRTSILFFCNHGQQKKLQTWKKKVKKNKKLRWENWSYLSSSSRKCSHNSCSCVHSHGISVGNWKLLEGVSKTRASSDKHTKWNVFLVSSPLMVVSLIVTPDFSNRKFQKVEDFILWRKQKQSYLLPFEYEPWKKKM